MPAIDTRLNEAKIYTMRQLNQDTGGVLREIAEAGQPAFVTRRGRFVARITPVPPGALEVQALSVLATNGDFKAQYAGSSSADGIVTSEQVRAELAAIRQTPESAPAFYTMRRLSHETATVMQEINDSNRDALVTRRGRPLAVVAPLAAAGLEAVALSAILERADGLASWDEAARATLNSKDVADDLDVRWRPRSVGPKGPTG